MKKLLYIARRLDAHAKQLIQELPKRGIAVQLLGPAESGATSDDAMTGLFSKAAPLADVIYLALERGDNEFPALGWDYAAYKGKLIVDLARCHLCRQEPKVKSFLAKWRPSAVVRDLRQIGSQPDGQPDIETLLASDYLTYSYLPEPLLADLIWFMLKTLDEAGTEQPPSSAAAHLLTAEAGDAKAQEAASRFFGQGIKYSPAIMRRALANPDGKVNLPVELDPRQGGDPLHLMSLLALEKHLAPGDANAESLAKLRGHVWGDKAHRPQGKRILLVVVYKQRDLFVDLILRYHLEQMGHEVIMRSLGDDPVGSILEVLPEVIIWGAKTTPYQVKLAQFARDHNIVSIVRREEAGTPRWRWEKLSQAVKNWSLGNIDYSPLVDLELVFGDDFAEILQNEGHLPPERCKAVGAMTFDPYFLPDLLRFMPDKDSFCRRFQLDANKKIMLLLTPWTYADRDPQSAIPEAKGGGANDEQAAAEVLNTIKIHKDGRQGWLEFLETIYREKGQDWNLILKVHPGERVEAYGEFFKARGLDIKLVVSGYVVEMLHYADLLVHAGSTTAIEAHFLGKPSLAYWVKNPQNSPIYNLVPYANTYEEFEALFRGLDLTSGNADESIIRSLEKELYGRMDGAACQRAAAHIHALINEREIQPFRYFKDASYQGSRGAPDPYGTNITSQEADYYYSMVKACLQAKGTAAPGQGAAPASGHGRDPAGGWPHPLEADGNIATDAPDPHR